nr:immunoglobulin heavy chain junction region [Mus musculus]
HISVQEGRAMMVTLPTTL